MLDLMNGYRTLRIGQLLLNIGGIAVGLVFALIATLRDLFAAADSRGQDDHRSIQDSDLIGDYNSRTQQFDSGTDPAGWYEDEP
jgi:hypothetical protein